MPTIITTQILPGNTVKLTLAFTDDTGSAATSNNPTTWSLKDSSGNVINNRSSEDVTEASSIDIVLSGDDLAPQGAMDDGIRIVSVSGTYNSDAGNNLSLDAEHAFVIGDALVPVSLGDAKRNLNIDDDNPTDDYLLAQYITEARQEVERITGRKLITQTVTKYFDGWPDGRDLVLPYGNLQSVTSLRYADKDGAWHTVAADDYIVETEHDPGRIVLDDDGDWPTTTLYESKPIEVVFVCGYGDQWGSVPFKIRRTIMLMVNEMYELREPFVIGTIVKKVGNPLLACKYAYGLWGAS